MERLLRLLSTGKKPETLTMEFHPLDVIVAKSRAESLEQSLKPKPLEKKPESNNPPRLSETQLPSKETLSEYQQLVFDPDIPIFE